MDSRFRTFIEIIIILTYIKMYGLTATAIMVLFSILLLADYVISTD